MGVPLLRDIDPGARRGARHRQGLPTTGLLAQVLVAKFLDHLPLYRQEAIFEREAGHAIALDAGAVGGRVRRADAAAGRCAGRGALRQRVLHADETPVAMLKPGHGKTHRAYLWSYCSTQTSSGAGGGVRLRRDARRQHVRDFLACPERGKSGWQGSLVTDDFSGYKALFELGVTEAGCMAHARRKFHELWANHQSTVGEQALKFFGELYAVEREIASLDNAGRLEARRRRSRQVADALHQWLRQQRQKVPDGSATARPSTTASSAGGAHALHRRWRTADRQQLGGEPHPADRAGSAELAVRRGLRAGKRAAAVMSLVHSAKLNGHDPYGYLKDVLARLPTQPASRIGSCCRIVGGR